MSEIKLKPAKKKAIPLLISVWGPQGCGKTLTAALLARGIVGPSGKIAIIDTENGRALFYAGRDDVGEWQHLDLQPPFTPERYSESFKHCEDAGANIIIVDSASHVWDGVGGVFDMADKVPGSGLHRWKAPKVAHKRMMNNLLRSPVHVIFCLRAKDAVKQIKNSKGETEIVSIGWMPICEKYLPYEMTIDLRLTKDGHYDLTSSKTIPDALRSIILPNGIAGIEMGKKIAQWAGAGVAIDVALIKQKREEIDNVVIVENEKESLEDSGLQAASNGIESYKTWKATLTNEQKENLLSHHSKWVKIAKEADAKSNLS